MGMTYLAMADSYAELGQSREAIAAYKKAAQGGQVEGYFGLAVSYQTVGDNTNAIQSYEVYLQRAPKGANAPVARAMLDTLKK